MNVDLTDHRVNEIFASAQTKARRKSGQGLNEEEFEKALEYINE